MAIEGFEEHLASKETKKKRKKSKDERKRKEKEEERENEKAVEVLVVAEENKGFDEEAVTLSEEKEDEIETNEEAVEIPAVSGEKRRGLADLVGMFNSRLWSLWSPGV